MAPNLITYKVCEGGMERFRIGGPKGIERGRVGRRPQRRGGGEGGREGGPEEPAGRYEPRENRRTLKERVCHLRSHLGFSRQKDS